MPDAEDVTFAVFHAGGDASGQAVATDCRATLEDVDAPLAQAVENGWLERFTDEDTGNLTFRLTETGVRFIHSGQVPSGGGSPAERTG